MITRDLLKSIGVFGVAGMLTWAGFSMMSHGNNMGWFVATFFGSCLVVLITLPFFPTPKITSDYCVVMTSDELACERRRRNRETMRWDEVQRIELVTEESGKWLLFEGADRGCAVPAEAHGFGELVSEVKSRFPGFNFALVDKPVADDGRSICWEK